MARDPVLASPSNTSGVTVSDPSAVPWRKTKTLMRPRPSVVARSFTWRGSGSVSSVTCSWPSARPSTTKPTRGDTTTSMMSPIVAATGMAFGTTASVVKPTSRDRTSFTGTDRGYSTVTAIAMGLSATSPAPPLNWTGASPLPLPRRIPRRRVSPKGASITARTRPSSTTTKGSSVGNSAIAVVGKLSLMIPAGLARLR
jgi:hypothetical protein